MTRYPRWIRALLAGVALTWIGCPSLHVEWADYNPGSFAPMDRFAFAPEPQLSANAGRADLEIRRANRALATREMREALEAKGYQHDAASPDYTVHFLMGEGAKDVYQPYGSNLQGELDVWFVRRGETDRFWHGWAALTLYGEIDATEEIKEAAVRVLGPVPPRR